MDKYPFVQADESYNILIDHVNLKPFQIVTLTVNENILYKEYFSGYIGGIETGFVRISDNQLVFSVPEHI